jgi:hypothetical protein
MQTKEKSRKIDVAQCNKKNDENSGVKGVYDLYPDEPIKEGEITISKYVYDEGSFSLYNLRSMRDGGGIFRMYDGGYVRLHVGRELMMSDTMMERWSNKDFVRNAKGDVLIGGFGIGMLPHNILGKPEVTSVTILELSEDLIKVASRLDMFSHHKMKVIHANVFDWQSDQKFDTIYMDIWATITTGNIEQINKLNRKYRKFRKSKESYIGCWMHDYLLKLRRQENRNPW